jgi:hydroxymethylpyrimidine pyrophosphatase-like HAD family hydrolase
MPIRCVYTDLDGTLLGRGASLFRDADGGFTMLAARGLEACHRAGVEVVIKSGRRRTMVMEDARLLGQQAYIYEVGSGVVIDGEEILLTGDLEPRDGKSVHDQIEESGAPRLLLAAYAGRLEYHTPWHTGRAVTHLMRGLVDVREANELLAENGHGDLRLVDNGAISPKPSLPGLPGPPHAYHLLPREASKARAVATHMRARGYDPQECVAVGDSREDLGVAEVVGRFFLVANALEKDPSMSDAIAARANVQVTEGSYGEGFYEAVVRSIAESRNL